jgi:hypothetical protein
MKRFKARQIYLLFILILSGFLITGCGSGGGEVTEHWAPNPTVTAVFPLNGAINVAINTKIITATFSEAMDPATLTTASFKLECPAGTPVTGAVTYLAAGNVASLTLPSTPDLLDSTVCTATVTTGAKNLAGRALASNFVWTFTTGLEADTIAPTLITTSASDGDTGLPVNRDDTATFSEPMDPATLASPAISYKLTLFGSADPIAGVVTYSGYTATFNPTSDLLPNTRYTSTITTGAKDMSGNALVPGLRANPWSWTTGAAADIIAPTVTLTDPVDLAIDVPVDKIIKATFSKEMRQGTMITTNFTVKETVSETAVTGTVAYDVDNKIATFSPLTDLKGDTKYTVTVTNGAQDLAGNALVVPAVGGLPVPNPWTFTTAAAAPAPASCEGPGPVDMGDAVNFGVLVGPAGGATLTNNGLSTTVNGDVGAASQTTAPKIGAGYTNYTGVDAPYVAAKAAMLTAISCAGARACSVGAAFNFGADHDFGGDTLEPGVYCVTGGMSVGSTLTLSTPGVYIFRSTGALTSANTIVMAFGGTANATNTSVFWVPTGAASIGTNNTFLGTIMPDASAATTLGANTTLLGRAMSNSDVTLSTNTITRPTY